MEQKKTYSHRIKKFYNVTQEIKDYFKKKEEEYLEFDEHPLSSISDLLDPSKPAPWDHLTNTDDDMDVDIDIQEYVKK